MSTSGEIEVRSVIAASSATDEIRGVLTRLIAQHPRDAARALGRMAQTELCRLLFAQATPLAAEVTRHLNPEDAAAALAAGPESAVVAIFCELDPAKSAELLARFSEAGRRNMLERLPRQVAKEIEGILTFPPGTAGRLMDRRVTMLDEDSTVEQALARLRRAEKRRVTDLMIVDPEGRLKAVVPLHIAVAAPLHTRLSELAQTDPVSVLPMTTEDEVVETLEKHRLASIPVVNMAGHLEGVIRNQELMQAAQQNAAAAAQTMVGASREERALSTPWAAIKSRLPWLQINLVTAFLASAVVGLFDETIGRVTALAVLMPVVAGQSGNTGAQALAITQRGLALREIRTSHVWRMVRKEALVGVGNGVSVAVVTSLGVFVWSQNWPLAGVIGVAMVFSMLMAAVSGAIIPIVLTALGRDPATASSIILTTVTDIVGFFSFLGLASVFANALTGG